MFLKLFKHFFSVHRIILVIWIRRAPFSLAWVLRMMSCGSYKISICCHQGFQDVLIAPNLKVATFSCYSNRFIRIMKLTWAIKSVWSSLRVFLLNYIGWESYVSKKVDRVSFGMVFDLQLYVPNVRSINNKIS